MKRIQIAKTKCQTQRQLNGTNGIYTHTTNNKLDTHNALHVPISICVLCLESFRKNLIKLAIK